MGILNGCRVRKELFAQAQLSRSEGQLFLGGKLLEGRSRMYFADGSPNGYLCCVV